MTGSEFLVVAVLIGLLPALIAQSKGHNFLTWWVFGALMFIVALPLALMLGRDKRQFRRCPDCGSDDVPFNVPVCKHCGRDERAHSRGPVEGWYPDPDGNGTRYWNGFSWTTEHKPASSA